ncbi:hypothetical protein DFO61_3316 [Ectopseudomonas oleovorans]|uniref:Tetratricopeptide repeat protein n=1 Tax=Ectopseudomonas oleovorans TaxID=301 RepID=A0A397MC87_ECTOL|nr:hypothetical protein [Pseudomonas oleovorans]RIA22626.1 hypothetical protein DFO61_3316 [Pseudomonas oleovorans]
MALQQTKGSEITDRLNALAEQRERPTPFEVQLFKRDIEKVKQVDLAEYHMLLGMLYSIAGDYQRSVDNHRKSIYQTGDVVDYANFGMSLLRLGKSLDSLEYFQRAFEMSVSAESFTDLLWAMMFAADFSYFDNAVEIYSKAHPHIDVSREPSVLNIRSVRNGLSAASIPEEEFRSAMGLVESVIVDNGYRVLAVSVKPGFFDGVQHVYAEILLVQADEAALVRLNDSIAEALIDSDLVCWDRMVFNATYCPGFQGFEAFEVA